MDRATQVRQAATRLWDDWEAQTGGERLQPDAPLLDLLIEAIEVVHRYTVAPDATLIGTNVQGEANPEERQILYRADLPDDRAAFVVAHELGHLVLQHSPLRLLDTEAELDDTIGADALDPERQQTTTKLELTPATLNALQGYSERLTCEREANAFASEVLAPAALVQRLVLADPEISVETLATRLGVARGQVHLALSSALLRPRLETSEAPNALETTGPTLDARQKEAVAVAAPARILAGPGAGKTRVLVERFTRLVSDGTPPGRILALTFANKAAGEMRERLVGRVAPEHAAAVEVSTFHAFGLKLLQEYGHHLGLSQPLRLVTKLDALLLLRPHIADLELGSWAELNRLTHNLRDLLDAVSRAKDEDADPARWQALAPESGPLHDAGRFYGRYQGTLRAQGCVDYADLIFLALRVLEVPEVGETVRSQYDQILVDEFQDINYSSGRLVKALDGGRQVVWAVGDPRQSIYGFRGASPVNLGRFTEDYPDAATIHLDTNYRSLEDIVVAGQNVPIALGGDPALHPPRLTAHRGRATDSPSVELATCASPDAECRFVAGRAQTLHEGGIPLANMAVLCRRHKDAQKIADALSRQGIAHTWGGKLEERHLFKVALGALLLADDDPQGLVSLTTLAPLQGIEDGSTPEFPLSEPDRRVLLAAQRAHRRNQRPSARALLEAARSGKLEGLSATGVATCAALLTLASGLSASARPFYNLSLYLFEHAAWFRRLISPRMPETFAVRQARATLGQLFDLAGAFALRGTTGEETSTTAFLAYLRAALDAGGLDCPATLAPGGDAVSVLTAHASKGLEWPVVFVPFATPGVYPPKEQNAGVPLLPGLEHTLGNESEEAERDEACLFYVAVTRAKDRLVLTHADRKPLSPFAAPLVEALRAEGRLFEHPRTPDEPDTAPPSDSDANALPWPLPNEVSEFALTTYGVCPRKFAFAEIYGLEDNDTAYRDFHRVVLEASADPSGFAALWEAKGPPSDHWMTPLLRQRAEALLARPATQSSTSYRQKRSLTLGETSDGRTRKVTLSIHKEERRPDGSLAISHLRTSGKAPKSKPEEDRYVLYSLYASEVAPDKEHEILIEYAQTGESQPIPFSPTVQKNRRIKLLKMIDAIEQGAFPPKPGQNCETCPYCLICSHG